MALSMLLDGAITPSSRHVVLALLASLAVYVVAVALPGWIRRPKLRDGAPPVIAEDHGIYGAWRFWTNRWEFFSQWVKSSATGNFSFWVGKHPVVGMSGEQSRKTFFESKQFGLNEGYSILYGMIPSSKVEGKDGEDTSGSSEFEMHFDKSIIQMMQRENMMKNLPDLIADTQKCITDVSREASGIMDPFESLYNLVFLLTMRTVGCNEIARDPALLEKMLSLYETFKMSFTPTLVLFPMLPTMAMLKRGVAGLRLYWMVSGIISKRKKTKHREDDPLQVMIDRGDDMGQIISVMIGALFAAQQNSGINAGWVLLYLATNAKWNGIARKEVLDVANKHFPDPSMSLVQKLAALPYDAWENEFPMLYLCLKDSIRLHANGACFRRNTSGRDIVIGKEIVPPGSFASYHIADIHLDPEVYPDPETWDPSRYLPGREEDKKRPLGWLGWGAGRHPCVGMKFARLEQNIIIAHFLATFDFEICDRTGKTVSEAPATDFNAYATGKPRDPTFLRVRPTESMSV